MGCFLSRHTQYGFLVCMLLTAGEMQSCLLSRLFQSKWRTHTSQSTSSPSAGTLAAPASVPAQARSLDLSHSPLSLCKWVCFSMVLELLHRLPHMGCSHFCPCCWCAPHRPFLHPAVVPCCAGPHCPQSHKDEPSLHI